MTEQAGSPVQRQELRKTLKPQWVWAMALGSAIGWGAFVLPQDLLGQAGPLGASLGLVIGGALMCVIAVSYGLLIRHFPVSGGEYAYAYTFFGRTHAFVAGWALVLGYISIIALNASALALLFRRLLPAVVEWVPLWEVAGWQVYLGEVVVASAALVLSRSSTRGAARCRAGCSMPSASSCWRRSRASSSRRGCTRTRRCPTWSRASPRVCHRSRPS
ncbi:APC family permease [uncultured Serinicoccus sp.]|uniref:APC family permease n=1 Tax=uncultured Serinicoccus sp. TaxID=735514 RepID=UPI0034397958